VTRKGSNSTSSTLAWDTLARYLATGASGPMPMKRVFALVLSPRIRILPNQLSFKTQCEHGEAEQDADGTEDYEDDATRAH
jgi:hypothetical protein